MRSRTGSGGKVVTSTITRSSSRMSVTPPWAPEGALSAALVSSTTSPMCSSAIAAISSIVRLGVSRHQTRRCVHIDVVPCSYDESDSPVDFQLEKNFTANPRVRLANCRYWCSQYPQGDRFPHKIEIVSSDAKDPVPLRS